MLDVGIILAQLRVEVNYFPREHFEDPLVDRRYKSIATIRRDDTVRHVTGSYGTVSRVSQSPSREISVSG